MNREDILSMAKEAFKSHPDYDESEPLEGEELKGMERFAALVAAYEREECAKVCDRVSNSVMTIGRSIAAQDCASIIRERGNPA